MSHTGATSYGRRDPGIRAAIDEVLGFAPVSENLLASRDSTSGREDIAALRDRFQLDPVVRFVHSDAEWQEAFVAIQDSVDVLLTRQNITGAVDWNSRARRRPRSRRRRTRNRACT